MELSEVRLLAEGLLSKHKLNNWTFQFDNSISRFGVCKPRKKIISISRRLAVLNNFERVKDVILHEIAHALVPQAHHNNLWKQKAGEIGCLPERCYPAELVATPMEKYKGTCPSCGESYLRHRKRNRAACRTCCNGQWSEDYVLIWETIN